MFGGRLVRLLLTFTAPDPLPTVCAQAEVLLYGDELVPKSKVQVETLKPLGFTVPCSVALVAVTLVGGEPVTTAGFPGVTITTDPSLVEARHSAVLGHVSASNWLA